MDHSVALLAKLGWFQYKDVENDLMNLFDPRSVALGAQIKEVEEDGAEFTIRCEDGTSLSLELTIPGSSVSVRDQNEHVEYLG